MSLSQEPPPDTVFKPEVFSGMLAQAKANMIKAAARELAQLVFSKFPKYNLSTYLLASSLGRRDLKQPFKRGTIVLVRRSAGPAGGRGLYQALAQVTDIHNYNYRLHWLTQGPAVTRDLPNTESDRFWPHRHLAQLPNGISVKSITAALLLQKEYAHDNSANSSPQTLLARRKGELPS